MRGERGSAAAARLDHFCPPRVTVEASQLHGRCGPRALWVAAGWPPLRKMADTFGDELFSVFEDDSAAAPGTRKEQEKGKWKGPPGPAEKAG